MDEVIQKAKIGRPAPVYVLGRESIFGYPMRRMHWVDPKYGLGHWLQINRGPESAMPEALQYRRPARALGRAIERIFAIRAGPAV